MAVAQRMSTVGATKKFGTRVAKKKPAPKKATGGRNGFQTKGWGLPGAGDDINLAAWYGPNRKLFLPGGLLDASDINPVLDGTAPGDYGLDPFNLSKTTADFEKYRVYEIIHARWAMLAVAGIAIPEALAANGADIKGAVWYETGAVMLGDVLNYDAEPWGVINNPLPLVVVTAIEVGLLFFVETYRSKGTGPQGYVPGKGDFTTGDLEAASADPCHPGGPFDPFGLADDPEKFAELKVKEIKNGRLGMVAFLGCAVQAAVNREGAFAAWSKHVSDPFGYNLVTIVGSGAERSPTL
mmetsp:Transcript_12225/g.37697  ORF Transcript_12225/g.37697 Transcript_12225/m.37697 type:complete len:296 (-) Transcript_12225:182-1069(-)